LLGTDDDSVKFNTAKYYIAGENNTGDITTEDFVIEIVFRAPAVSQFLFTKQEADNDK